MINHFCFDYSQNAGYKQLLWDFFSYFIIKYSIMNKKFQWWEAVVKRTTSDSKSVTEHYLFDALTYTDAELKISKELESYGDFKIIDLKRRKYVEVFESNSSDEDYWYQIKSIIIVIDENTDKEKKTSFLYLVQSSSLESAIKVFNEKMRGSMSDYVIDEAKKSSILEVYKD